MANNQINQFLDFANMQMAAESFLLREGDGGVIPNDDVVRARLEIGNNRASFFTANQAEKFTANFQVLTQHRNDPLESGGTGFSATLFKKRGVEEYTLSIRSTVQSMCKAWGQVLQSNIFRTRLLAWQDL